MYELTLVVAIFVAVHLSVFFVASEVLQLDAFKFAVAVVGAAIVSTVIAKIAAPDWQAKVEQIIDKEKQAGDVMEDIVGVVVVLVVGAVLNNWLIVRRYGVRRWAGILLINALVNAFI